jgi:mono/diheme cytochrome c family protein
MANTAEAVDATHETSEAAASSGRPRRLQTCIACHGSGELPMRANRRLYRLLTSASVTATAGAAQRPMASDAEADDDQISL